MKTVEALQARLEAYLRPQIELYRKSLRPVSQPKIVRDVIWGFNLFEPYELAFIDSPPFQRLRNIFQTSLALYTYPCSVHSRFEHSLGAAAVASKMLDAISRKMKEVDPVHRVETRLSALLHDISHGPFSHSSEAFYGHLKNASGEPIFALVQQENSKLFGEATPSEIITYLLLTTAAFQDLWNDIRELYKRQYPVLEKVDLERFASMILGVDIPGMPRFYRQIVNGPFDADKLDYLPRDGYFTGLQIVVDIERLLHTVSVAVQDDERNISVVASGASVLEQVIFAKTQLYSSVYHHHKVRAAHRMLHLLLHTMLKAGFKPAGYDLSDPISFAILDDYDLLHSIDIPDLNGIVSRIKCRVLPKRALVISYPAFEENDRISRENFNRIDDAQARKIEKEIERGLGIEEGSVFFDLPTPPKVMGTGQALVELDSAGMKTVLLQDIYPAGAWAKAYAGYRKIAYVFTTLDNRRRVGEMARTVLSSLKYPVKLNENALALAKAS